MDHQSIETTTPADGWIRVRNRTMNAAVTRNRGTKVMGRRFPNRVCDVHKYDTAHGRIASGPVVKRSRSVVVIHASIPRKTEIVADELRVQHIATGQVFSTRASVSNIAAPRTRIVRLDQLAGGICENEFAPTGFLDSRPCDDSGRESFCSAGSLP